MHRVLLGLALVQLSLLSSCGDSRSTPDARESRTDSDVDSVQLATLWKSTAEMGLPAAIIRVGERLAVLDVYGDSVIVMFDASSGVLASRFGRRGGGPGEFRGPQSLARDTSAAALWIHDLELGRLTRFGLDASGVPHDTLLVTLSVAAAVLGPKWRPDGFIALGFFDGGRFAIFAPDGSLVRYVGAMPTLESGEKVPAHVVQHAYQGKMDIGPSGTPMAVADRHASLIELYHVDGTPIRKIEGPVRFRPVFTVVDRAGGAVFATDDDLVFGYTDVVVLRDRIFALYSGRRRRDYPGRAVYGGSVHVFSYSGVLRSVAILPSDAIAMAASERDSALYIAVQDPEPAIIALNAAPLLRSGRSP
jgi:hypothetical protein